MAATTDEKEVEYHNPSTGTDTTNDLEVDRDANGNVERINFPTGGWKEVRGEMVDNADGTETYTDEQGHEYTVKKTPSSNVPKSGSDTSSSASDDEQHSSD